MNAETICTIFAIIHSKIKNMSNTKFREDRIINTYSVTLKDEIGRYIYMGVQLNLN